MLTMCLKCGARFDNEATAAHTCDKHTRALYQMRKRIDQYTAQYYKSPSPTVQERAKYRLLVARENLERLIRDPDATLILEYKHNPRFYPKLEGYSYEVHTREDMYHYYSFEVT